jgi:hypothetical protein
MTALIERKWSSLDLGVAFPWRRCCGNQADGQHTRFATLAQP